MIVYRYENKKGIGPFRGSTLELDNARNRHSSPNSWMGVKMPILESKYIFAFTKLKTLRYVFEGKKEILNENGFKIVRYEVDKKRAILGPQDQVLFNKIISKKAVKCKNNKN